MTENVLVCIKQEWTEVLLSARTQRSGLPSFTFNGQDILLFPAEKTVRIVPRSHNPGLHLLPPHPCALACTTCMYGCTAPRMTHLSTLTQAQVQFSTSMKRTAYRDQTTSACQDDVMLGRPTAAVARHSLCPRISPFPCRQTPHHRRLLISCSGSPWESRETSQQMGFHLVTLPTARSDYMASSSSVQRPKLPGVVSVGSLSSKTWTHAKTGNWARVVCSFCPKEGA